MTDVIFAPRNDTELKAHRKTYHERQLFHLYAAFLFDLVEVALERGLVVVFSWNDLGTENIVRVE
jgi:hypothetical protein